MTDGISRRSVLGKVGIAVAAGMVGAQLAEAAEAQPAPTAGKLTIVGLCCSPRSGKTTTAAMKVCLESAGKVAPHIQTELIELAGMNIPTFDPASPGSDDFTKVAARLSGDTVAGIIIGTPVYFSGMSSLCKAFLDQCMVFRKNNFALRNKVAGVLAVGGVRNGGQELAIQGVQAALMCQEMIVVGDGKPSAHSGATVLNTNDDVSGDEFGLATVRNLGTRVAEVAIAVFRPSPVAKS